MQPNRAEMKLLTECAYSSLLRNVDADVAPIFEALDTWMPEQSAGPIGLALLAMVGGRFEEADERLTALAASSRKGRKEAQAVLAMCKVLRCDKAGAEELAEDVRGGGGSAAANFVNALTGRDPSRAAQVAAE